jgi:hypothetical protein
MFYAERSETDGAKIKGDCALSEEKPYRRSVRFNWCPEGDLNPHSHLRPTDFKSAASANFAIRALAVN